METYNGHVRSPADAIILFEACRLGLLPRVQRRLSEKERQSIRSGSVFVWDEREAGMRRWTDGKSWSASRVSGSFLTYREMEGKRGGGGFAPPTSSRRGKTPESGRNSGDDREMDGEEGPDGYRYKPDGLMKQSFSITTSTGQHLHLISYYARSHPTAPGLQQPTNDPTLRSIRPQKGMYPESTVNDQSNLPAVPRSAMPGALNYGTVPHPLVYGPPPGATHPRGYIQPSYAPQGYAFPPSPMSTPPNGFPMPHYAPNPSGLPPIATNGHHPSMHYGPPMSHPPHHAVDQRAARASESSLPPPPPMSQYSNAAPHVASTYMQGQPSHHSQPAVDKKPSPPQATASLQIDPRLMGPTVTTPVSQSNGSTTSTSGATSASSQNESESKSPVLVVTTAASQAPSIGALMNGSGSSGTDENTSAEQGVERQASTSPGGSKEAGPQDIPSEKLGFREDKRALRQLDKVFTA